MPLVNRDEFISFHRDLFVAVLREDASPWMVAAALAGAGIDEDRVCFLQGDEGLRILNPEGTHGSVKERMLRKAERFTAERRILELSTAYLRTGRTLVYVHDVTDADAVLLLGLDEQIGIEDCHYAGGVKVA